MKPLSERDENFNFPIDTRTVSIKVGMKPLSERDENRTVSIKSFFSIISSRNEATL